MSEAQGGEKYVSVKGKVVQIVEEAVSPGHERGDLRARVSPH